MKLGYKISLIVNLVLAMGLGVVAYMIVFPPNVEPHADGRSVVLLSADERNLVLGEMRGLLETVQVVIEAATEGDMETVSTASTAAGMVAAEGESAALLGKLPIEFMTLGMGAHKAFDALALTAQGTDDPLVVLGELGGLLNSCTNCHSGYRLGIEGEDKEE